MGISEKIGYRRLPFTFSNEYHIKMEQMNEKLKFDGNFRSFNDALFKVTGIFCSIIECFIIESRHIDM